MATHLSTRESAALRSPSERSKTSVPLPGRNSDRFTTSFSCSSTDTVKASNGDASIDTGIRCTPVAVGAEQNQRPSSGTKFRSVHHFLLLLIYRHGESLKWRRIYRHGNPLHSGRRRSGAIPASLFRDEIPIGSPLPSLAHLPTR